MKFNFSLLSLYIILIIIVKTLYSITFFNISYHKIFSPESTKKIDRLDLENDDLEWTFLIMVFLLMSYVFASSKKNIVVNGHLKHVLLAGGLIGIYSQLQKKHFFGLLDFLHVK